MSQVLEAQTGRARGSRPSGRLRREGIVPGVLYGMGMEPVVLSVDWPSLRRALNADGGLAAAIRLRVAGKEHLTLVKELQRHPVRRDVIHIDFLAVDPDEPVNVEVAVVLSGVEDLPASINERVVLMSHRIEITAKPNAIPAELVVDVSGIAEDQPVRLSDVTLPAGVTTEADPETVIAEISSMALDPEIAEEEAAAAAEAETAGTAASDGGDGAEERSGEG